MRSFKSLLLIFFAIPLLFSCNNDSMENDSEEYFQLKDIALIDDDIILPVGTKWKFTDEEHNEVEFKLPKGYQFLLIDNKTKASTLTSVSAGYSCTCTGSGSCITFYNSDVGYGCLHGSCTKSCVGRNTSKKYNTKIEGVLYTENDMLEKVPKVHASLSQKGKELIFENIEFQKLIKSSYDLFYKHYTKPDFSDEKILTNVDQSKYVFVKCHLYGVEIGLLLPNDKALENMVSKNSILQSADAPTSCSCSGEGNSCILKKKGAFGYVAYYCSGCSTCTMN